MRKTLGLLSAIVILISARPAAAAGGTITDQAVSLVYTSGHWGAAPNAWLYGTEPGGGNPLFRSGWWYRVVGVDTREYPFPPPDTETYANGKLTATWNNVHGKGFYASETTWVFDQEGPSGGFHSEMYVSWGANPVHEIALFHLLDVDVAGSYANDSATLRGLNHIKITDGASIVRYRGTGWQRKYLVAPYDNTYGGAVKRRLNDDAVDNFENTGLPFGPGDFTGGMQFQVPNLWGTARITVGVNQTKDYVRGQDPFLLQGPGPGLQFRHPAGPNRVVEWGMRRGTMMREGELAWGLPLAETMGYNDFKGDAEGDIIARDVASGTIRINWQDVINGAPQPANVRLGASDDFNADGKADLLWFDTSTRKMSIWLMNGEAKIGSRTPNPDQAVDANWDMVGSADADGDGDPDLLWYNQTSGRIVVWNLDANQVRTAAAFTDPMSVGSNVWKAVAWGDYGRGTPGTPLGTPDVIWQNDVSKKIVVWHMDFAGRRVAGSFTSPDVCSSCGAGAIIGPR